MIDHGQIKFQKAKWYVRGENIIYIFGPMDILISSVVEIAIQQRFISTFIVVIG